MFNHPRGPALAFPSRLWGDRFKGGRKSFRLRLLGVFPPCRRLRFCHAWGTLPHQPLMPAFHGGKQQGTAKTVMRLLFLMQGLTVEDHPGYGDALRRLLAEGVLTDCVVFPYHGVAEKVGWDGVWREMLSTARDMAADAVFLQYFHGPIPDPADFIAALRDLPSRPVIAVSSGDPFGRLIDRPPKSFRSAARHADVTFVTETGGLARDLARSGARVALMPNGYCQARFDRPFDAAAERPEYDVAFIGNLHRIRNPASRLFRTARKRRQQAMALQQRYGQGFALFGSGWDGWPSARGPISYDQQHAVCRKARVVVGPFPNGGMDYYMSDRSVITIRSGVPFIDAWVPRVDRIFATGRHWFLYRDCREMLALCDRVLAWNDDERQAFGRRAAEEIAAGHSQYHRMREMVAILRELRRDLVAGRRPLPPRFEYFLPGIDPQMEVGFATAGWA